MVQPHLQRTKLCDLKDGELDPIYVKRREQLKDVVSSLIRPKLVQGKTLNGKEFVSFLEQVQYCKNVKWHKVGNQINQLCLESIRCCCHGCISK